jgi:oligopeptide transport system ATP-binding protein
MIAVALSCGPRLVIADEITTALDVTIQAQILDLLKELASNSNTAFLLITHDMGIVAGMTQRVHVMYAGRIVEKAPTRELFRNPRMPYTWGLLRAIPRVTKEARRPLIAIEGMPPDLASPPRACRFEPRCPFSQPICGEREPQLLPIGEAGAGHEARCWGVQDVPGGGWLRQSDWRQVATAVPESMRAT